MTISRAPLVGRARVVVRGSIAPTAQVVHVATRSYTVLLYTYTRFVSPTSAFHSHSFVRIAAQPDVLSVTFNDARIDLGARTSERSLTVRLAPHLAPLG